MKKMEIKESKSKGGGGRKYGTTESRILYPLVFSSRVFDRIWLIPAGHAGVI